MEETISLKEIFEVIKKRIWLMITFVISAALIAAVVSYFILTPTYESSSQFIVNQGKEDPAAQYSVNDIRMNVEMINTYNVIIKSAAILEDVVAELNLPYTAGQLENKIDVSSAQNSQVVTVTVTDPDPVVATNIANATVTIFQDKVPELMNVDNVKVLSEAHLAADPTPVAPKPSLNIAIAIVLGGMVGVGLAFLLEYLDTRITTEEDLEKHLGLPLLGTVTHVDQEDLAKLQVSSIRRGEFDGAAQKKTS